MKRILQTLLIGLSLIMGLGSCTANAASSQEAEIKKLIKEFDKKPGCSAINLGSLAVRAIKAGAKKTEDDDAIVAIRAMDKIHGVSLLDMEECNRATKNEFHKRLLSIIGEDALLMSVKDEEDDVLFYGRASDDGETIENLIIYFPDDGEMICLWGSISTEGVAGLAKSQQE